MLRQALFTLIASYSVLVGACTTIPGPRDPSPTALNKPAHVVTPARGDAPIEPSTQTPIASETLDMLKAEILDTVTLDKPIHFTTPEGRDVMAAADLYRVEAVEATTLRLTPENGEGSFLVQAVPTSHRDAIALPIAVAVPEAEDTLHIVLLLPGGKALEAVGSLTAVRARAGGAMVLSPEQLHQALLRKQAAVRTPPTPGRR